MIGFAAVQLLCPQQGPHLPSQVCANLDSAVVSTTMNVSELEERVPRPVKTFDIAEERPEVRSCHTD